MSSLLEHLKPAAVHDVLGESNILVYGMIAVLYGRYAPNTPIRGWGSSEQLRPVLCNGLVYTAGSHRQAKTPGCRLSVKDGQQNTVLDVWAPWEAFATVTSLAEVPWEAVA